MIAAFIHKMLWEQIIEKIPEDQGNLEVLKYITGVERYIKSSQVKRLWKWLKKKERYII